MKLEEIKELLEKISFSNNFQMIGTNWDVKETKIYDNGVVSEKGYSIRTTFMRPDVNTGEVEKGYGRWMYVPENVSTDGLVKTAWVCADLIVKHELMEAFLYNSTRIFDPHKSLSDLSYNGRIVNTNNTEENNPKRVTHETHVAELTEPQVEFGESSKPSSSEVFHQQNIELHISEVSEFLEQNFKKEEIEGSKGDKYVIDEYMIFHYKDVPAVQLAEKSGKVKDYRTGEMYNLSEVKKLLGFLIKRVKLADPAVVNQMINSAGFKDAKQLEEDGIPYWIYSNPVKKTRYIYHSEVEKSFVLVNEKNEILKSLEEDEYTIDNIRKLL